jgi:hypothetical protein
MTAKSENVFSKVMWLANVLPLVIRPSWTFGCNIVPPKTSGMLSIVRITPALSIRFN